jgi:two-component system chemotaxis response regulator CheB
MTQRAAFDIVALCASAGGFNALLSVLSKLPDDFAAPIVVVQHLDPRHRSVMAELLARRVGLRVAQADEGDRIAPGLVLIAPPDNHMLVNADGTISLTRTQLVHFVRPSADLLFESVAASFTDRALAVVLTGTGSDGSQGVVAVKKMGGTVIVQDEGSSEFFGMPGAAIRTGCADFILALDEMAPALVKLIAVGEEL